mmetsp:Transcript_6229/g.16815  ORF Transcript_6229/g.16815 Transcript_6229/m.16815 type:complete len:217 (-) Transcript_6229:396-1046(-)
MYVTNGRLLPGSRLRGLEPCSLRGRGRVRVRLVASPFVCFDPFSRITMRIQFQFSRFVPGPALLLVRIRRPFDEHVIVRDVDRVVIVQVVVEPDGVRQVFTEPSFGPTDDVLFRQRVSRPEGPVRDPGRGVVREHVALQHRVAVRLEHRLLDVVLHAPVPAALVDGGDVRALALGALLASHPVLELEIARRPGMGIGARIVPLGIVVVVVVFAPAG